MQHDAYIVLSVRPFVRQLLLILALGALGSLVGSVARSVVLPSAAIVLGLAVAVLVPATGVRTYLLGGTGTFDYAFQRLDSIAMAHSCLMAGGLFLLAYPFRGVSQTQRKVTIIVANVALAGAVIMMLTNTHAQLTKAPRSIECQIQSPTVCGPAAFDDAVIQAADISQRVVKALPSAARTRVPDRLQLTAPGLRAIGAGDISYDTAMRSDGTAPLTRGVIDSVSGIHACPPEGQSEDRIFVRAALAGWLVRKLGVNDSSLEGDSQASYPLDLVERIEAMPSAKQSETVTRMMEQVWGCDSVNLEELGLR